MNPSTEDIIKVIKQSQCKRTIILPNNRSIMMASKQTASTVEAEAAVIPTKSILQGVSILFQYDLESSLEDNKCHMSDVLETVQSGSITFAARDTRIDGIEIKKDEFMGLAGDKIMISDVNQFHAVEDLLNKLLNEDSEILTVISGESADNPITNQTIDWIKSEYPDVEVEQHEGG